MSSRKVTVPTFNKFFAPTIHALQALGGTATVDEIAQYVADDLALTKRQRAAMDARYDGRNLVRYRAAWARTFLRKSGYITSEQRGVWTLTPAAKGVHTIGTKREKLIMSFFRDACAARS